MYSDWKRSNCESVLGHICYERLDRAVTGVSNHSGSIKMETSAYGPLDVAFINWPIRGHDPCRSVGNWREGLLKCSGYSKNMIDSLCQAFFWMTKVLHYWYLWSQNWLCAFVLHLNKTWLNKSLSLCLLCKLNLNDVKKCNVDHLRP